MSGQWIGGTGKYRWYRFPLGEAIVLGIGNELNGGVIVSLQLREDATTITKPVDVKVRYANVDDADKGSRA